MITTAKKTDTNILKWAICIFLAVIVLLIPIGELFTSTIRTYFSITVGVIAVMAFDLLPMMISSLTLLFLYVIFGIAGIGQVLEPWTNVTVYMVMIAMVIGNVLNEVGLLSRISYWCIDKCGGTFTGALYGYFLAGTILSIASFNNSYLIIIMMVPGICKAFGFDKPCKESALISIVAIMGAVSPSQFFYTPLPFGLWESNWVNITGQDWTVPWYAMTVYNWGHLITCLVFIWLLTKIYKTKNITTEAGKDYFKLKLKEMGPMSLAEKKSLAIVGLMLLYLFTAQLHGLPIWYSFFGAIILMFIPGIKVGTSAAIEKANIGTLVFFTACMAIGNVATLIAVPDWLVNVFSPMLQNMSGTMILVFILLFGTISNIFLSPTAMVALLPAIFIPIAQSLNMNIIPFFCVTGVAVDTIFLPHEHVVGLMVFGFGMITVKDFIKNLSLKMILSFIVLVVIQVPFWKLIGLL